MHVKRKWRVWMSIFLSLYLVVLSLGTAGRNGGAPVEAKRTTTHFTTRVVDSPSALMGPQLEKRIDKTISYVIAVEKNRRIEHFYRMLKKRKERQEAAQRTVAAASIPASYPEINPRENIWWELAGCETGYKYDNPNTGNGYYGFFQFSLRTWQSVGGTGYPYQHSYAVQLQFAQRLARTASPYSQWPRCWPRAVGG